jgi:hypothetical protein
MTQNLILLFAPEHSLRSPAVQATLHTPPAPSSPDTRERDGSQPGRLGQLRFMASVAGNAAGFAGIIAGCWMGLQVLQAFM